MPPDCHDQCAADAAKTSPGTCGCGVADTDSDGDGYANRIEALEGDPGRGALAGQVHEALADVDPHDLDALLPQRTAVATRAAAHVEDPHPRLESELVEMEEDEAREFLAEPFPVIERDE